MAFETKCDHIIWTGGFTVKEFLSAYGKKLPVIVKVVQGFHGDYLVDSLSTHEILRVHTHSRQKRVIGQDTFGQHLSIPVDFEMPLELVIDGRSASPPTSLKSMLNRLELPFRARLPNVTPVSPDVNDLGIFRLDSQFEQRHLLVNFVLVDELEGRVRMIPSNIEGIRLAVGTGFDRSDLDWQGFQAELDQAASSVDFSGISGSSDIALYAAGVVNTGRVAYENLIPSNYLSVKGNSLKHKPMSSLGSPEAHKPTIKEMIKNITKYVPKRKMSTPGNTVAAVPREKGSSHYEPVLFRPRSSSESQIPPNQVDYDEDPPPQACGNPSESPKPPRRTVRDKPRKERIQKELPSEPFVYRVTRKASTETKPAPSTAQVPPRTPRSGCPPQADPLRDPPTVTPVKEEPRTPGLWGPSQEAPLRGLPTAAPVQVSPQPAPIQVPSATAAVQRPQPNFPISAPKPSTALRAPPPTAPKPGALKRSSKSELPSSQVTSPDTEPAPADSSATSKPHLSVKPLQHDGSQSSISANQMAGMHQVPNDLSSLTTDEICQCLGLLHLREDAIDVFRTKQLDGNFLKLISENNLRQILEKETRLSLIDRERTINFLKHQWRPR